MTFDVIHQPATTRQRRVVAGLCLLVVLSVLVALPVASTQLPALPHIAGIYGASAAMIDFATFWLLMSAHRPSHSLRIVAAAYLFAGLMAVLHVLTFPGALLPNVSVLGNSNTVSWLFITWRAGFPAFIVWAVLSETAEGTPEPAARRSPIGVALVAVVASLVLAWAASDLEALVPGQRGLQFGTLSVAGAYGAGVACAATLALVLRRGLAHRALYLWLVLVLLSETAGVWLSTRSGGRYTVAWYGARAEGLVASAIMLALLAAHYRELQARLNALVVELSQRTDALQAEMQHRERAERMIAQSQKLEAVGQLAAGLAHDINNFLQVIGVRTEMLRRRLGEAVEADAEVIQRNVRKTEHLTRQLLSFAGRRQLQPQVLRLAGPVADFVGFFRSVLGPRVVVDLDLAPDAWPVRLDPTELETALANLLSNARDAMAADGTVTVRLFNRPADDSGGDRVVLEVSDAGEGIPAAVLERVFEPFFTTKQPGKGSGLGLSQVYAFAKASGGSVAIDSEAGVGTTVRLVLPRHLEASAAPADTAVQAGAPAGQVVLLVDDNLDILESTSALLELNGMVVKTATGGAEAWALLAGGLKPDVVVSDIVMAGSADGVELARRLRAEHPSVRTVLASAYSAAAADATAQGLTVLRKPYDAAQLLRLIADGAPPQPV